MSCIAVTSSTADKARFPTLFRVNQASELYNPLRIKMMKYYGWSRVGTIVYQDDISVSVSSFLYICILINWVNILQRLQHKWYS